MAEKEAIKTKEPTTVRRVNIPDGLKWEMEDENRRQKASGKKQTTEQTMLALMRDGLKLRSIARTFHEAAGTKAANSEVVAKIAAVADELTQ